MKYISSDDLILIGEGANAQVYKYNQPFCDGIPSAAVKIGQRFNPRYAIEKYEIIKHAGCFTLAFYEECRVDGKPAIIMEDLFTDDKIYVSPNSYGRPNCKPEMELANNPLTGLDNAESVLMQLRSFAMCCNGNGIGLDFDMISFGMQRGDERPFVTCKLVDIDALLQDNSARFKLMETNVVSAKEAFEKFVLYFVKKEARADLYSLYNNFNW